MLPHLRYNNKELIERCLAHDAAAWDIFIKKYTPLVAISVKNRLSKHGFRPNDKDVEDISQNVFTSMWGSDKLSGVRDKDDISWWLAVVSGNAAVSYMRKKMSSGLHNAVDIAGNDPDAQIPGLVSGMKSPRDTYSSSELSDMTTKALDILTAEERAVIKMHFIYFKKYKEISEMLGIPVNTVASHTKRAKEKLKEHLKGLNNI